MKMTKSLGLALGALLAGSAIGCAPAIPTASTAPAAPIPMAQNILEGSVSPDQFFQSDRQIMVNGKAMSFDQIRKQLPARISEADAAKMLVKIDDSKVMPFEESKELAPAGMEVQQYGRFARGAYGRGAYARGAYGRGIYGRGFARGWGRGYYGGYGRLGYGYGAYGYGGYGFPGYGGYGFPGYGGFSYLNYAGCMFPYYNYGGYYYPFSYGFGGCNYMPYLYGFAGSYYPYSYCW